MKFHPLHFSWVSLPAQPRGVVVFIGGAFFGTFPTLFYRGLLRDLYNAGFAVVALPFRFSLQHWDIALSLAIYQDELKQEISSLLQAQADQPTALAEIPYFWLAHSLGCKYLALLELLSERQDQTTYASILKALQLVTPRQAEILEQKLNLIKAPLIYLLNQPQILIDPVITDLDAAIPLPILENLFAPLLKVQPSRAVTFQLIKSSRLFALTSILSLTSRLAAQTVQQLSQMVRPKPLQPIAVDELKLANPRPLFGRHLAVLGFTDTDPAIRTATLERLEQVYPKGCALQGCTTLSSQV